MIKQHLRQAWTMMKQQKLFTSIYIAGTAISIAMAMTIFVVLYIKLGPLYPEENRDSMVIFRGVYMHNSDTTRKGEYLFELSLENAEKVIKESKYIKEVCTYEQMGQKIYGTYVRRCRVVQLLQSKPPRWRNHRQGQSHLDNWLQRRATRGANLPR